MSGQLSRSANAMAGRANHYLGTFVILVASRMTSLEKSSPEGCIALQRRLWARAVQNNEIECRALVFSANYRISSFGVDLAYAYSFSQVTVYE